MSRRDAPEVRATTITIFVLALAACGPSLPSQTKTRIEELHRDFPVGTADSKPYQVAPTR